PPPASALFPYTTLFRSWRTRISSPTAAAECAAGSPVSSGSPESSHHLRHAAGGAAVAAPAWSSVGSDHFPTRHPPDRTRSRHGSAAQDDAVPRPLRGRPGERGPVRRDVLRAGLLRLRRG